MRSIAKGFQKVVKKNVKKNLKNFKKIVDIDFEL